MVKRTFFIAQGLELRTFGRPVFIDCATATLIIVVDIIIIILIVIFTIFVICIFPYILCLVYLILAVTEL
jgi:hypothetical protein